MNASHSPSVGADLESGGLQPLSTADMRFGAKYGLRQRIMGPELSEANVRVHREFLQEDFPNVPAEAIDEEAIRRNAIDMQSRQRHAMARKRLTRSFQPIGYVPAHETEHATIGTRKRSSLSS